jgi:hypothetical protein
MRVFYSRKSWILQRLEVLAIIFYGDYGSCRRHHNFSRGNNQVFATKLWDPHPCAETYIRGLRHNIQHLFSGFDKIYNTLFRASTQYKTPLFASDQFKICLETVLIPRDAGMIELGIHGICQNIVTIPLIS